MVKVYITSDIHTDYKENLVFLQNMQPQLEDTLIVAGDVTDKEDVLRNTLETLKAKFANVAFCPGNHDLWVRSMPKDKSSVDKFHAIIELCKELGVHTSPFKVSGGCESNSSETTSNIGAQKSVWIVPLFSWYTSSFDSHISPEYSFKTIPEEALAWMDFHVCRWPTSMENHNDVCKHFLSMNEPHIAVGYDAPVLSFSHFLPLPICLPPFLLWPHLRMVSGDVGIDRQIRRLGSKVHVFGHTHVNIDKEVDGVRYIQHSLKYPRERSKWNTTPSFRIVWDSEQGFLSEKKLLSNQDATAM